MLLHIGAPVKFVDALGKEHAALIVDLCPPPESARLDLIYVTREGMMIFPEQVPMKSKKLKRGFWK